MSIRAKVLAAALTLGATLSVVPAAGAAVTWSPTATRALPLVSATDQGALPPSTPLRLAIGLKLPNPSALSAFTQAVNSPGNAQYGHYLTPAQFLDSYAPSTSAVTAVTNYLREQGLTNIAVASDRLYVTADATAAQATSAFHTSLERFTQFGGAIYANTSAAEVPSSLSGAVLSVLGLDDIVGMQGHPQTSTGCSVLTYALCAYNPQGFRDAYHAAGKTGSATSIAIMAEGDLTGVVSDLRTAEKAFGEPQVPTTIVPAGVPSTDTSGADEFDLDSQYSSGIASNVKQLYLYDATSLSDSDIGVEFNKWVSQDVAKAASASFGECEALPYLDGFMLTNDEAMNVAAAQGQTMHASSGDTGGQSCAVAPTNGVPSPDADVNYPCSSPYIVCVGGTSLFTNRPTSEAYSSEIGWDAGGGGVSLVENSPFWQKCVVPTNAGGLRGVPDISMDADPNTGATVYVNGAPEVVGGTSLSSPLALGSWAIMESADANRLGFAAPLLYGLYPTTGCVNGVPAAQTGQLGTASNDPSYPLHDVILGSNAAYTATPGWDYVTGLGSYDIARTGTALAAEAAK